MFSTSCGIYGLKLSARCLTPQLGSTEGHSFLVGTTSLREDNEIHVIDFDEELNEVKCKQVCKHPREVWSLTPSPHDPKLLFTCTSAPRGDPEDVSLWRLPDTTGGEHDVSAEAGELEEVLRLPAGSSPCRQVSEGWGAAPGLRLL